MAKVPALPTLTVEGLKSNPENFVDGINNFFQDVRNCLANGLTVGDNMAAQFNTIRLQISDRQSPYPFAFEWLYPPQTPAGCLIVAAVPDAGGIKGIYSGLQANWTFNNNRIVISGIAGQIDPNAWYTFTFLTIAE